MNVDSVLSWAGSQLLAADLPVSFAFGLLIAALLVAVAIALVVQSAKSARAAEFARAEAETKFAAAENLAEEVRRMRSEFELAAREHEGAIQKALHEHNASCAASHAAQASPLQSGEPVVQTASLSGDHDHDDDDDDHKKKPHKKHSADEDDDADLKPSLRSFMAFLRGNRG
jgi:hypothetical protein